MYEAKFVKKFRHSKLQRLKRSLVFIKKQFKVLLLYLNLITICKLSRVQYNRLTAV